MKKGPHQSICFIQQYNQSTHAELSKSGPWLCITRTQWLMWNWPLTWGKHWHLIYLCTPGQVMTGVTLCNHLALWSPNCCHHHCFCPTLCGYLIQLNVIITVNMSFTQSPVCNVCDIWEKTIRVKSISQSHIKLAEQWHVLVVCIVGHPHVTFRQMSAYMCNRTFAITDLAEVMKQYICLIKVRKYKTV